jgi:hypothetical protein
MRHCSPRSVGVVGPQVSDDRTVVLRRGFRPPLHRREELARRVCQRVLDEPANLRRTREPVNRFVEPVIEPLDSVVVVIGRRLSNSVWIPFSSVYQGGFGPPGGPGRELTTEKCLGVIDVSDIVSGKRGHRETAP